MGIVGFVKQAEGLEVQTTSGIMRLVPYSERIVRVRFTLDDAFHARDSLAVVGTPRPIDFEINETESHLTMILSRLSIAIDKATGAFTYLDHNGALLTKEPDRGGKTLDRFDLVKSVFDESTEIENVQSEDGLRIRVGNVAKRYDRPSYHYKLAFEWADGEALYGLGSHQEGMMNLRGQHQYLYQQNMKAVVPVLMSTRGYGVLFDNYSLMTFRDDAFGSYVWAEAASEMDYYFIVGPEMDDIVTEIRSLTGKAPILPKWAYGYIQSKLRYTSQQELIEIVAEYRKRGLPLDCVVLDWKSWPGALFGQKTFDKERFPDPTAMMERIHDMDARLMISIWPIMSWDSDNNKEMAEQDCLLGNRANYNPFLDKGRELYWKQANEGLFMHGIDAWWCDCTEPFEADWKGAVMPEPEQRLLINTDESKLFLDPEYINAYSLLHSKGMYEGQRATTDRKRVVNLTRSSYIGQHRYATITWSGDTTATWDTYRKQIPDGLNFCATGCPYWTLDIGAFFVSRKPDLWFWSGEFDAGVEDKGYQELYTRWFQYGAFLPMFRSHGTDTPREVWRFGEPGQPFYDSIVNFLHLRYRLMPYIYSLAAKVHREDYTMMRALAFDFRNDPNTFDIKDQYMFGPAFLINPVTEAMYYGPGSKELIDKAKTRTVYLPAGNDWYDYWTTTRLEGGMTVEAAADIDRMPLYVRAGSIVPMGDRIQYAHEGDKKPLQVRIYPGSDASFVYYEDEGDSYDYEEGASSTVRMEWVESERLLRIGVREGYYPGMREEMNFVVQLWERPNAEGSFTHSDLERVIAYHGAPVDIRF